jgi:hypothetical protein
MATWRMKADPIRNRLYGALEGFFTAAEMKQCADDTIEATKGSSAEYNSVNVPSLEEAEKFLDSLER